MVQRNYDSFLSYVHRGHDLVLCLLLLHVVCQVPVRSCLGVCVLKESIPYLKLFYLQSGPLSLNPGNCICLSDDGAVLESLVSFQDPCVLQHCATCPALSQGVL